MKQSLLVVSKSGNMKRVYTPFAAYNINSPLWRYGKIFIIDSIILEQTKIYFVIDGERYEHGYFEIFLRPQIH
jgi:hypothetical protein